MATIVHGDRLVDRHALELSGRRLDGIEDGHRLAIVRLDDEVRAGTDVVEDGGGADRRREPAAWAHEGGAPCLHPVRRSPPSPGAAFSARTMSRSLEAGRKARPL